MKSCTVFQSVQPRTSARFAAPPSGEETGRSGERKKYGFLMAVEQGDQLEVTGTLRGSIAERAA